MEQRITKKQRDWASWFPAQVDPETKLRYQVVDKVRHNFHALFQRSSLNQQVDRLLTKRHLFGAWDITRLDKKLEDC